MTELGEVAARGLVLLGCGKMGTALLEGWLAAGLPPGAVWVTEPAPHPGLTALAARGLHLNAGLPNAPAVALLAVKPQMMAAALPGLSGLAGGQTLFLSIAAGLSLAGFATVLGAATPVVRAMPNTPAAIGRGISALIGNAAATPAHLTLAETLLGTIGAVVRLEDEAQMDVVTALSGSGPAYVFHLVEAMTAAGMAQGLPEALAAQLARATVAGSGALLDAAADSPAQLRINVTSPGGTTAAALLHLMDPDTGLPPLMVRAVAAGTARGRELGRQG